MKTKMSNEDKIEALERVCSNTDGELRSNYSGRGMYGDICYGIVTEHPNSVIEQAGAEGVFGASTDNMGMSTIVYWKHVKGDDSRPD